MAFLFDSLRSEGLRLLPLYASSANRHDDEKQTTKKKGSGSVLVGSISSVDGAVTLSSNKRKSTGSLGVSKKKRGKQQRAGTTTTKIMSKKDRQRTGNGSVDSTRQTLIADPENENVEVLEAKRGNKAVTIIRGMTSPMADRKKLLKEVKRSFGVGGTLVDGVLEVQGAYATRVLELLQKKGYKKARKIGK